MDWCQSCFSGFSFVIKKHLNCISTTKRKQMRECTIHPSKKLLSQCIPIFSSDPPRQVLAKNVSGVTFNVLLCEESPRLSGLNKQEASYAPPLPTPQCGNHSNRKLTPNIKGALTSVTHCTSCPSSNSLRSFFFLACFFF